MVDVSAPDRFRIDGKVALVTGGGQGIGRAFALALAEAGAGVVIADINEQSGPLVAREIEAAGGSARFVRTDVTSEEDVRHVVERAVEDLGRLDIAVNNAWVGGRAGGARGQTSNALDMAFDEWDFVHDLLLRACFLCCKHEAAAMVTQGGGRIINVASISAFIANASAAYCSAKAGVVGLTRRLAAEWGGYNINVNSISPSYTLSPARRTDSADDRALIRSLNPVGWYGRPEDLTGTLVYLASDASSFVTGQDIVVDGGHTLNVWLQPPARHLPAPVSPEVEASSLVHDLDILGMPHDIDGVVRP
jgi:NAD(P)-dependent dehydrogenase (short-subunit alcohol dehydrogenase family)